MEKLFFRLKIALDTVIFRLEMSSTGLLDR